MAYSAPALFLVGAAQNLVLFTSADGNSVGPCWDREYDDNHIAYDAEGFW